MDGEIIVPRIRVCIGMPSDDDIKKSTAMCLAELLWDAGHMGPAVLLADGRSSIVSKARNQVTALAQDKDCTHLLFLDSDMVFPRDTLRRLLAHDKPIVGATYRRRAQPMEMMGLPRAAGGTLDIHAAPMRSGLREMISIPTGVMLIDMRVFGALKRPYFRIEAVEETADRPAHEIGEDHNFCLRAGAAGFGTWCDVDLTKQVAHIGTYNIGVGSETVVFGQPLADAMALREEVAA